MVEETSRRSFVGRSALALGGLVLAPSGCSARDGVAGVRHPSAKREAFEPSYVRLEREGELARREEALRDLYSRCRCCPRRCGVDRLAGETGVCSSTGRLKVANAHAHFGEEPPLVGSGGSGTIFFSACNLLCVYCQNWEINHRGDGSYMSAESLAATMLDLQRRGCENVNLVTPTHFVPGIVSAIRISARSGLRLPLVYNTGGYDSLEVVRLLDGVVDVYLPDFKYADPGMAATYSSGARDYPEVAAAVIREMYRQVGDLEVDERGVARRGLLVRHLVLPGNVSGTDRFVRWVAANLSCDTVVNLMAQYRPDHRAAEFPVLSRPISGQEWAQAVTWAKEAGLTRFRGV